MARLPRILVLPLVLMPACGDSGSDATGLTMLTTVSDSAPPTSGDVTTAADPDTTAAGTSTAPTSTSTSTSTDPPATTDASTAPDPTTTDATTGIVDPSTTTTGPVDPSTTTGTTDATPATTESTTADDTTTAAAVCGDGVLDPGEACDDGVTADCAATHDGGDGACVPAGQCSAGYVLSGQDCVVATMTAHVHIMVDNFCNMLVDPDEFSVLPGQKLKLEYHNHSVDYLVDVWMHYGGGFTDLEPGGVWKEQYEHCFGPNPSEGWADITTACSEYQLPIHCL